MTKRIRIEELGYVSTRSALSTLGRKKEIAAFAGGMFTAKGPSGANQSNAYLLGADVRDSMLEGIIDTSEPKMLQGMYRDIYLNDHICGAAVDLRANLPWSGFTLTGGTEEQLDVFYETVDRLNLLRLHPELSVDKMVTGSYVGLLSFDPKLKGFTDIININVADLNITPTPNYTSDPVLRWTIPKEWKDFCNNAASDPQVAAILKRINPEIVKTIRDSSEASLAPVSTIYIPRRSFTSVQVGISMYRRILPMYIIERMLYRGTITEISRRQRATLFIQAGDDEWMPTEDDLSSLIGLFQSAEQDPISSVVATRQNVNVQEIRCLGGSNKLDVLKDDTFQEVLLKDLVEHDPEELDEGHEVLLKDVFIKNNHSNWAEVRSWIYQGFKTTYDLVVGDVSIRTTATHNFLVYSNGEIKLMNAQHLIPTECYNLCCGGTFIPKAVARYLTCDTYNSDMLYSEFYQGKFDRLLNAVSLINEDRVRVLLRLLQCRYKFVKPSSFTEVGEEHVYDLHMAETSPPIFNIGGVFCKNSAGDFLKWTDMEDQFTSMKYKALGINESFLTGDSCLAGNQLVTTDRGIIRIDHLGSQSADYNQMVNIDIGIAGRYENLRAEGWIYNGQRTVYNIKCAGGEKLSATENHPILIVQEDLSTDWVRVDELKQGMRICANLRRCVREDNIQLEASVSRILGFETIDEDFAYLIGAINSSKVTILRKGCNDQLNNCKTRKVLEKFVDRSEVYRVLYSMNMLTTQCVPDLILRSSHYAQTAFIQGVIDSVGEVRDNFVILSTKDKVAGQIKIILSSHGIYSEVRGSQLFIHLSHLSDSEFTIKGKRIDSHTSKYKLSIPKACFKSVLDTNTFNRMPHELFYADILEGKHDAFLTTHGLLDNVKNLASNGYVLPVIRAITKDSIRRVYDITMGKQEPAFTAQGMVVHNTYNNMETALSVFMEDIRAERISNTHALYYDRLFPLISQINKFVAPEREGIRRAETASMTRPLGMDASAILNNTKSHLLIPEVHWHKPLRPEADQEYIAMLDLLAEKGVPVPIRVMAAAGGMDFDKLMGGIKEDIADRAMIKKLQEEAGLKNEFEDDYDYDDGSEYGSLKPGSKSMLNIVSRNYKDSDREIYQLSKTGKRLPVYNQRRANDKLKDNLHKSMQSLVDPQNYAEALKRASRTKKPRVRTRKII